VVLGEPVAVVAEFVGAAREAERLLERLRGAVPGYDGDWSRIESFMRRPDCEFRARECPPPERRDERDHAERQAAERVEAGDDAEAVGEKPITSGV